VPEAPVPDRRGGIWRRGIATACALALVFIAAPVWALDEGELLREIKSDVFDQQWDAVLADCGQFISQFPHSETLPRVYFYRAQAFEHIKGREVDAIDAYTDFLTRFPTQAGTLSEEAAIARVRLAVSLYLSGNKGYVAYVTKGLEDQRKSVKLFAALQASRIEHEEARRRATPILKDCTTAEPDPELKDQCVVALLRVNPLSLPPGAPPPPARPLAPSRRGERPPAPPAEPGAPVAVAKLIRVEVFDKATKQVSVRINLPIAFAELVLDSLSEEHKDLILKHIPGGQPMDLKKFWDSFRSGGKQTIVEVDNPEMTIKVWVE